MRQTNKPRLVGINELRHRHRSSGLSFRSNHVEALDFNGHWHQHPRGHNGLYRRISAAVGAMSSTRVSPAAEKLYDLYNRTAPLGGRSYGPLQQSRFWPAKCLCRPTIRRYTPLQRNLRGVFACRGIYTGGFLGEIRWHISAAAGAHKASATQSLNSSSPGSARAQRVAKGFFLLEKDSSRGRVVLSVSASRYYGSR